MLRRLLVFLLAAASCCPLATRSFAQGADASTSRTIETIDTGWQVVCRPLPNDRSKLSCSMIYELVSAKDRSRIISLELVRRETATRMLVVVPLGIDLRNGVDVSGAGSDKFKMVLETCQAGGCMASRDMPGKTLEQWKSAKSIVLEYADPSGARFRSEISLAGFPGALARWEKP